jgi:hypothetical protein
MHYHQIRTTLVIGDHFDILDDNIAAKLAEMDILKMDFEKATTKIASLTRENVFQSSLIFSSMD